MTKNAAPTESQAPPSLFALEKSWRQPLASELQKPYIAQLAAFVEREHASGVPIYPPKELIFNALSKTPYNNVKVVIVGQDPYHGPGQAHGLSFSVPRGIAMPPSLKNIFKELHDDLGVEVPSHGSLLSWAEQGVMLLNASLTVRHKEPNSHQGKGWEHFTDTILAALAQREDPVIFVLWGKFAKEKCLRIPGLQGNTRHPVLTAAHPSPFSANNGFFGSHHFSKINNYLSDQGKTPIDWTL